MLADNSARYGDLSRISAATDGRCHLCYEVVDLQFYGPPGAFGAETVNVDPATPWC